MDINSSVQVIYLFMTDGRQDGVTQFTKKKIMEFRNSLNGRTALRGTWLRSKDRFSGPGG
jgi:hypothetical protein